MTIEDRLARAFKSVEAGVDPAPQAWAAIVAGTTHRGKRRKGLLARIGLLVAPLVAAAGIGLGVSGALTPASQTTRLAVVPGPPVPVTPPASILPPTSVSPTTTTVLPPTSVAPTTVPRPSLGANTPPPTNTALPTNTASRPPTDTATLPPSTTTVALPPPSTTTPAAANTTPPPTPAATTPPPTEAPTDPPTDAISSAPPTIPLENVAWSQVAYPIASACGGSPVGVIQADAASPAAGIDLEMVLTTCDVGAGNPPVALYVYDSPTSSTTPTLVATLVSPTDGWHSPPSGGVGSPLGVDPSGSPVSLSVEGYSPTVTSAPCGSPDLPATLTWTWSAQGYQLSAPPPAHDTSACSS